MNDTIFVPEGFTYELIRQEIHGDMLTVKILIKNDSGLGISHIKFVCTLYDEKEKVIDFSDFPVFNINPHSEKMEKLIFSLDEETYENAEQISLSIQELALED